jgi:hypothetical protein
VTAFLTITDAVLAALQTAPALAGGRVYRGRHFTMQAADSSAIEISTVGHQATGGGMDGSTLQWQTTLAVLIKARAAAGVDAEAALDPLIADVWARLSGITPPTGAQRITLDPAIQIDFEETERTVATAALALRVNHITTTSALGA